MQLDEEDALESVLAENPAVLVLFDAPSCAVGTALEPKLRELLAREFTRVRMYEVDVTRAPALAAQHGVTATPTVVVFFKGQEHVRRSRSFGIADLHEAIERPYRLLFD